MANCGIGKVKNILERYKETPVYAKSPDSRAKIDKALELVNAAISARKAPEISAEKCQA